MKKLPFFLLLLQVVGCLTLLAGLLLGATSWLLTVAVAQLVLALGMVWVQAWVRRSKESSYAAQLGNQTVLLGQLQQAHEEIKAVNEELVASNEEFSATQEELRISLLSLEKAHTQLEAYSERELRRSRALFEKVVDSLPLPLSVYDATGRLEFYNQEVLTQRSLKLEDLVGKHYSQTMHPTSYSALQQPVELAYATGQGGRLEVEINLGGDKGHQIVDAYLVPIKDATGQVERLVLFSVDVTAERRLSQDLQRQTAKLTDILESTTDGFVALSKDWRITRLNQLALQATGLHPQQVLQAYYWEVWPYADEEIKDAAWLNLHQVMEGRQPHRFTAHSAGSQQWLEVSAFPISNGGIGIFLRDISERIHREEQLRNSEQLYRAFAEHYPGIINVFDEELTILFSSGQEMIVNGFTEEQVLGHNLAEFYPADYFEFVKANHLLGLHQNHQFLLQWGGKTYEVDVQPLLPIVARGPVWVAFYHNITERIATQNTLQSSLKEKEILLAEVHHRVKNNLAIVSSLLQLQEEEVKDEFGRNALQQSRNRVYAIALIHEHLYQSETLARIQLENFVPSLISSLQILYHSAELELTIRQEIDPAWLDITLAVPFSLLLNELITNSFKHAFKDRSTGEVSISVSKQGASIQLRVQDNGVGLPAHTFVHGARSLGITLIKGLTHQLKGSIQFDSNPGQGTQVVLQFPYHPMHREN